MKGWVMGVLLVVCSASADAQDADPHALCSQTSELAEQIARARYAGVPMRDLAEIMNGNAMGMALVRDAYDLPDWSSDGLQQSATTRFGNGVYSLCIDNLGAGDGDGS